MSQKRLAVVTGGARGIGRAIVMELLEQGRAVAALDLDASRLEELKNAASEAGYSCECCCVDITDTDSLTGVLHGLAEAYGGIGILVNNAGITRDGLILQMSDSDFDDVIKVNLRAAFVATRVASRSMVRNKFGRIISLSSVAGIMGNAGQSNYASSKAGLIGMSKSLARELARKKITVNCVAPGFIVTEMTDKLPEAVKTAAKTMIPLGDFGGPADVARAVAFLAAEESGYITGQVLCVDGGMAM